MLPKRKIGGKRLNNIYKKQNEDEVLLLLFSARKLYNRASSLNTVSWCVALANALFSNSDYVKDNLGQYMVIVSALFILVTLFLQKMVNSTIQLGANTKELIDRTLFGFNVSGEIGNHTKEQLRDWAIKEKRKDPDGYDIAVKNTGKDKPKGVKNWYDGRSGKKGNEAIFQCQKENAWYDKEICRVHAIICWSLLSVLVVGVILSYWDLTFKDFIFGIFGYISLIIKITADLNQYKERKRYAVCEDVITETVENSSELNSDTLKKLQGYIYKRRATNYIPFNFIHTILAKKLHEEWEEKGKFE